MRAILTESGRIIDDSSVPYLELINGKWVLPTKGMLGEELMNGRVLSEEELSQILKSDKPQEFMESKKC